MTTRRSGRPIHPVLLSGGMGVRLWPLSREMYPKQLLNLASDRSMLQETARRVGDPTLFAPPTVICNQEHRFLVAEQLRHCGVAAADVILEPVGRNTAPACAVAALRSLAKSPEAMVLLLPSDHVVRDQSAFAAAVDRAAEAAERGYLVTFGITPDRAETGYGYIRPGAPATELDGVFRMAEFVEKPSRDVAEQLVAGGRHLWNSGMFLFPADQMVRELERHAPAVLEAARRAIEDGVSDLGFFRLAASSFGQAPPVSIDVAVMERTDMAVVVPCDPGWNDVGSWSALWETGAKDGAGNVGIGDVVLEDASGCYVRSEGVLTAAVGVKDTVVVVTEDAVLVAARDRAQDVKALVERLKGAGRQEPVCHLVVHRPWGSYQGLHAGDRFQVKRLTVTPGSRLSLQRHHHRAEHWVVVQGTALVTRGDEQLLVYENQSVYIPMGTVHRLENPGKVPLKLIEVQSGSYFGEDDIVRLEDSYGRS